MKRILIWLLAATVLLTATSCISIVPDSPNETVGDSTQSTTQPQNPPVGDDLPTWYDADTNAMNFWEGAEIVDCSKREYSYTEMEEDLRLLAEKHPTRFSYSAIGSSLDGREIYVGVLGNPNAEKQILVSAGIHGREYLTPLLVMMQLEFYLTYYDNGNYQGVPYATLFDQYCFYVVPMTNPDGIMISQQGISALRDPALRTIVEQVYRKDFADGMTSQTEIDSYLQYWKANAAGVDLNRNFDALWAEYKEGMGRPCHATYKGPTPNSEPETRAMIELTESLSNVMAVLCIHSQGEVLYWNCGQEGRLAEDTLAFTQAVSNRCGYTVKLEKNNDASFSDWCALERDLIAVTVETGVGLCPLDYEKLIPIWQEHYDLLPLTAFYFTYEK
ncbi:MAG: peptidase [Clostridia bacterium]|nr:peptidase [Clostridia bacterium]